MRADGFAMALRREYGWLLAPEVRTRIDAAWGAEVFEARGVLPEVYMRYTLDPYLLRDIREPALLLERPWNACREVVDKTVDLLWERAAADYMVTG